MQGWRISMEDSHTAELKLPTPNNDSKTHPGRLSFFGVFDGHGGDKVALFTGENIHNIILKQDTFKAGDYAQGLKDGFLATDRAILNGTRAIQSISEDTTICMTLSFLFFSPKMKRKENDRNFQRKIVNEVKRRGKIVELKR